MDLIVTASYFRAIAACKMAGLKILTTPCQISFPFFSTFLQSLFCWVLRTTGLGLLTSRVDLIFNAIPCNAHTTLC